MTEYEKPLWSFTRTNEDGTTDIKSFEAVTWSQALQEFVYFVKGCGYGLDDDSIQIKDSHENENWFGKYCEPFEDDWQHPDDFYPPFEGDPDECTFTNVT